MKEINRKVELIGSWSGFCEEASKEFIEQITATMKNQAEKTVKELGKKGYVCFDPNLIFKIRDEKTGISIYDNMSTVGWRCKTIYVGSWFGIVKDNIKNFFNEISRELKAFWYRLTQN